MNSITLRIAAAWLGLASLAACSVENGIDLSNATASSMIKRMYGYPREVLLVIRAESFASNSPEVLFPDMEICTPKSKGKDSPLNDETKKALFEHAVCKGWVTSEHDKEKWRLYVHVSEQGKAIFRRDGENWVAVLGIGRFREVSGISGAVGADRYTVEYTDDIPVNREWRGAGGTVLADDIITEFLATTFYRYANGWRLEEN